MADGKSEPGKPLMNQRFTTTHWSVVRTCGADDTVSSGAAMEQLCRTYWYPLYAYVRRRGHSVDEAQDLTQEFFARLIEKEWVSAADANKGRFRTFLLTALSHFLAKEWRRLSAGKRGGGKKLISLDDTAEARYVGEPTSDLTPEKLYERRWALSVFDQALSRLREQHVLLGKDHHYECFKKFLSTQPGDGEYAKVGQALEMSPGAVAAAVHRLRQQYRELVRAEVAHTVESTEELEEEMRWLL
jgi:RNA polymerase sigma-70 factor (ECF subfamily)